MKIQILGTGCARCDNLYNNAQEAVKKFHNKTQEIKIEKVANPEVFLSLKVFMTPALVIDNEVVSVGKVLTSEQIQEEINRRMVDEEKNE
ncbi:MAG: thioredoxin family protein [Desulfomonilaceae bacterium]